MAEESQTPKCTKCGAPLDKNFCHNCRRVHCPYCGESEEQECDHIIASWAGLRGYSNRFSIRSPFPSETLPYVSADEDSPLRLLPVDKKKARQYLSSYFSCYHSIFEPPDPVAVFQLAAKLNPGGGRYITRGEPGMASMGGRYFYFSPKPEVARSYLKELVHSLQKRIDYLTLELLARLRDEGYDPSGALREDVVYGEIEGTLVFAKKSRAEELVACYHALSKAKTWREFRDLTPAPDCSRILQLIGAETFVEFYQRQSTDNCGLTWEQAKEKYLKLPFGKRVPQNHDPFDPDALPWVINGEWPGCPADEMREWVPEKISNQYGSPINSKRDGYRLIFKPKHEKMIVNALRLRGYVCTRDDALVERASGYNV